MTAERPRVAFVSVPSQDVALGQRAVVLPRVAAALGLELDVLDARRVRAGGPDVELDRALAAARAVWWAGPILRGGEAAALVSAIRRRLGARAVEVIDDPDAALECDDLARSHPLVAAARIPVAETRIIPLAAGEPALGEPELRALLRSRLEPIAGELPGLRDGRAAFFRTCYGTRKTFPVLNVAESLDALVEGAADLIAAVRGREPVGGLAVRELLPIARVPAGRKLGSLSREHRVFVVAGAPRFWGTAHDVAVVRKVAGDEVVARVAALEPRQLEEVRALAARAGAALRARLFTADFAVLDDGRVVLLETNPGHCSGWGHDAALVGAHGQLLRFAAGLPPARADELAAAARAAAIGLDGRDATFGFFEP